jgi:hypothetical protein
LVSKHNAQPNNLNINIRKIYQFNNAFRILSETKARNEDKVN